MLDYSEFDEDYAMVRTTAPRAVIIGMPLTESGLREHFNVTVVAIKHCGGEFTCTTPETVISDGDQLIVSGSIACVESFADLV